MSALLATTGPSAYWYLTRGSGVVALILLTASICLGIAGTVRWRTKQLPRFAIAALHRNLTLIAIAFVGFHVVTTVLDGYAPIGWKDAFLPFFSSYRPVWTGLGAVTFDLLLALVVTSLLRARIGIRAWRAVHWLAYASWPVALVHSLGTGSDARAGWLQVLGLACGLAVAGAVAIRLATSRAQPGTRLAIAAGVAAVLFGVGVWYQRGPGEHGWAARAGTPASLIAHTAIRAAPQVSEISVPASFTAQFSGSIAETQAGDNLVNVRIDGTLSSGVRGRLRLVLQGVALDGGGVGMTSSGVAFSLAGTPVYEGHITSLQGASVAARVSAGSSSVDLRLALRLGGSTAAGTVVGRVV
jgi:hypothetical protein